MKRHLRVFPRRGIRRFVLMLLLIAATPRIAPAASYFDLRVTDVKKGESTDNGQNFIEIVDFQWSAKRNETHSVQFSPDLVQPFFVIDSFTLSADGAVTDQYFLPPNTSKGFFRIGLPQVQINSVQPSTIFTGGGSFFIIGQLFDPTDTVRVDGNPVSFTFIDSSTIMVTVASLTVGFHDITLLDGTSAIIATFLHGLNVTSTGRTDQESPPAAPEVNWARAVEGEVIQIQTVEGEVVQVSPHAPSDASPIHGHYCVVDGTPVVEDVLFTKTARNGFEGTRNQNIYNNLRGSPTCIEGDNDGFVDTCYTTASMASVDKIHPLFAVPRVNEATGELFVEYLDLVIPGRGLDLVWGRTYRSKIGFDTPMGVGWDFSYNIRAAQSGSNITVQDGQNRTDTYFLQTDGSFSTDELFRRGTLAGNVFTLQFADKTSWIFKPLDGSSTSGKIDKIIDRNSNQLQFQYDGSGRLFIIIDTLGRPFQISYDGANRIQAVQDFSGRTLQYQHLTSVVPGVGGIGDLVLVRSQAVTGTPIGNDFPSGKVAQFTYSTGLGGARDHNLLTARDGLNVQWFQAVYTPTAVTTDFLHDRVSSEVIGTASETRAFTYLPKTPDPSNRFNIAKTIVNDAVGNVHESLFDSKNRLIDLRQFTGRSTPGVAVTESTNRPTGQLRPTDPAFFKTTIDWNRDSLPTRMTWPRGNGLEMVYHRDFDPAASPRERANLRVRRQLPVSGAALVERFEYQPGFGTREQQFRPGKWTMTDYNFETPITSVFYPTDPQEELSAATERARRRFSDALISEVAFPALDGVARDAAYMTVKLQPETPITSVFFPHDPSELSATGMCVSNTRNIRPNSGDPEWHPLPAPDVPVSPGHYTYGWETRAAWAHRTDARGFDWRCDRDANGNAMSVTRPDGVTTDLEHNANGQLTAIVLPPNASAHRERDEFHYYTTGAQNGYLQSIICDAGGLNLTTGFTPNPVGEVIQVVDPRGKDTPFFVNQLNQVVQMTSRDAGSGIRYLTNIFRDANNRVTSIDVQNKDEFGIVGANAFFTTGFGYDVLDHITSMTREVDSAHTVTTQYFYNAIRDLIEMRSPLVVSAVQPDARVQYAYDERNLPFTSTAAPGSGNATGSTYGYDANGNLNTLDSGAPAGSQHTFAATYDGFDYLSGWTSPVGTQLQLGRNANHQVTSAIVQGNFLDLAGNPLFGPLRGHTFVYDAKGLLVQRIDDWFDPITSSPLGDGARTTSIMRDPALNVISITDDNGHTTLCSYDNANRPSRVTDAKGNHVDYTYDPNDNVTLWSRTDKSDTAAPDQVFTLTNVYDGVDRLITSTDNVGNTSSSLYDSRSNCVRHVDPRNNLTQFQFDGLNRPTRRGRDMNANNSGFDPNDIVTGYAWDDNSRFVGRTDPNNHTTQYVYDALGRLTRRTNADTTFKTWNYNPWGSAIQSNDENGTLCINTYDNNNRLKQRQITPGSGVSNATTFELFDYPGDYHVRERAINDAGNVRYTYDSLGRVLSEKLNNRTTTYSHDGVGNLITLASPGGRVITYAYDLANLCTGLSLTTTSDGDSLGPIATCSYVGRRVESATHRNGTSTSYTYDGFVGAPPGSDLGWGQLAASVTTGPGATVIDQRAFTYDAAQNLSERRDTRTGGPQLLHHYDYDAANRKVHTQVNAPGPTVVRDTIYNYDLNGNRVAVNGTGTPDPGVYIQDATTPSPADAQMNQYTTTPLGNYAYDANGNRINLNGGGGNTDYKYDYRNRLIDLTNVNTGLRIANYQYDALNRRIQKTLDPDGTPSVTNFVYTVRRVLEERDSGGAVTAAYTGPIPSDPCDGVNVDDGNACTISGRDHISSWEHQYEYALGDGRLMGESEIWWFSFAPVQGETKDEHYSFAPVEMRRGGTNYTYHAKFECGEHYQWWLMTNASGAAVERYDYEDFGDPHVFDGAGTPLPSSAIGNPYLFKGMRFDGESGLYLTAPVGAPTGVGEDVTRWSYSYLMFDPKIGASLQRESSHAVNAWQPGPVSLYAIDPKITDRDASECMQIPIM